MHPDFQLAEKMATYGRATMVSKSRILFVISTFNVTYRFAARHDCPDPFGNMNMNECVNMNNQSLTMPGHMCHNSIGAVPPVGAGMGTTRAASGHKSPIRAFTLSPLDQAFLHFM